MDFAALADDLNRTCPQASFIPEIGRATRTKGKVSGMPWRISREPSDRLPLLRVRAKTDPKPFSRCAIHVSGKTGVATTSTRPLFQEGPLKPVETRV